MSAATLRAARYPDRDRPAASRRPADRRRPLRRRARSCSRIRLAGFLVLLFLVLVLATWTGVRVAHAGSDPAVVTGTPHIVQPGETLWGIAVSHYGSTEHDVRELIDRIMAVNGLESAELALGDRLTLPFVE